MNSSYINSCCLLTYCRRGGHGPGRGSALGAAPTPYPHKTWEEGEERWSPPLPQGLPQQEGRVLGLSPCLPQSREPLLLSSPSWTSVAGWDQAWCWETGIGRDWKAWLPPSTKRTHTHTHTYKHAVCTPAYILSTRRV